MRSNGYMTFIAESEHDIHLVSGHGTLLFRSQQAWWQVHLQQQPAISKIKILFVVWTPLKKIEKDEFVSGMMNFPIYGTIKSMFQTTNQKSTWDID